MKRIQMLIRLLLRMLGINYMLQLLLGIQLVKLVMPL